MLHSADALAPNALLRPKHLLKLRDFAEQFPCAANTHRINVYDKLHTFSSGPPFH